MSSITYRPEVDGLRALAVVPVILFHLGFTWIQGGFVGVDVFFVISGYLISLIILREQQQGVFSFRNFWIRRARRILPALSSVVLASMIAGYFILFRLDWKNLGGQGLSVFALIANLNMWKLAANYWAPAAHETPLLHTWSLAVEEQFYLFYPLLLITILKFAKQHTFKLILAATIFSFAIGLYATRHFPAAAFYLLPPRAWELAAGCLLAILTNQRRADFSSARIAPVLSMLGVVGITASYFYISKARGFPGYQAVFPVIGTVLVIAFTSREQWTGRILASAPVSYLGKISYSLYLWHWPVIVYAHLLNQQSSYAVPVYALIGITLILSVGSYHLIEKPARFSKNWVLPVSVLALTSIAASAGMYSWRVHYNFSEFSPVVWNGRVYDVTPNQKPWEGFMKDRMAGITAPLREQAQSQAFAEQGIIKPYSGPDPEIVVFGDSHALMWASTIDKICEELGRSVSFFAADGTSPSISVPPQKMGTTFFTPEEKFLYDSARLRILGEKNTKLVILAGKYSDSHDAKDLESLLGIIEGAGAKCLIIEQPPMLPFGDKNALIYCATIPWRQKTQKGNLILPLGESETWRRGMSVVHGAVKKFPTANILDIADLYLSDQQHIFLMENHIIQYIDDDHLSENGALKAKSRIKQKVLEILGS